MIFPQDLDDVQVKKQQRPYMSQDWKKQEELDEFLKVYLYNRCEDGEVWNAHHTKGTFLNVGKKIVKLG